MEEFPEESQEDFSQGLLRLLEQNRILPTRPPVSGAAGASGAEGSGVAATQAQARGQNENIRARNSPPNPLVIVNNKNKSSFFWDGSSVNILNKTDSLDPDLPDAVTWEMYSVKNTSTFVARPKGIGLPIAVLMRTGRLQGGDGTVGTWHPTMFLLNDVYESDGIKGFKQMFENLSMGSVIYVTLSSLDPRKCSVDLHMGNYRVERFLLSYERLKKLWCYTGSEIKKLPPVLDLKELKFKDWVHDKMMVVTIKNGGPQIYGFKTFTQFPEFMYSELRTFLRMPPHPNIIGPPCYLVSKSTLFSRMNTVDPVSSIYDPKPMIPICGFLVPYLGGVDLDIEVRKRAAAGNLPMQLRVKWCRQLAGSNYHLFRHGAGIGKDWYHRRLRMKHVFVSPDDDIILRDLEIEGDWEGLMTPKFDYGHERSNWWRFVEARVASDARASRYGHQCLDFWVIYGYDGGDRELCLVKESALENFCSAHWENSPVNILNFPDIEPGKYKNRTEYDALWASTARRVREYSMLRRLGKCLWCILHGIGNWKSHEFEKGMQRHDGNWPFWDEELQFDIPERLRQLVENMNEMGLYDGNNAPSISEFAFEFDEALSKSLNKRTRLGIASLTVKLCEMAMKENVRISDVKLNPESLHSEPALLSTEYSVYARIEKWRREIVGDTSIQGCTNEAQPEESKVDLKTVSEMAETERQIKEAMEEWLVEAFMHGYKHNRHNGGYYE
ncbi:hypothetical protein RUND412_006912 [Rhizina undulata]